MQDQLLRRTVWGLVIALFGSLAAAWQAPLPAIAAGSAAEELFESKVRPVLAGKCFRCHGGDKVRGGLRIVTRAALLKGGNHGPAIVPGDADKSLLIQAVRFAHDEIKMPPGKQLPAAVVDDLAAWVNGGAVWPERSSLAPKSGGASSGWALKPLQKVVVPAAPSDWANSPIDCFILAKLHQHGLMPAGLADKRTLIRRATFDLIGLPPTPEEVEAFLADDSPEAFARVVDRLLASPHYGEHWGRHWLDVVRYADTGGFEADHLYPNAWQYRDYVIRSLSSDKPFDTFVQEQVAGDELWPESADARTATALYCVGPTLAESAMISNQLEHEWLTDAVDTTGAAFLGLTFGCARCHDHKYDPIPQKDYYAMQAIFAASDRPFPDKVRLLRIKGLNGLLSDAPVPKDLLNDPRCTIKTEKDVGWHLFHRHEPWVVHRLGRGELSKPREVVAPAVPTAIDNGDRPSFAAVPPEKRRAVLAQWLTSRECPLTARVLVNRVWGWHFGQALVRTPNDFGAQGEPPTHPELHDWLARDLIDHGWCLKRLHRIILLSSAYRMSSVASGHGMEVDPEDRLLWHFPRRRLEGEAVRDALLAVSGTLNRQAFGKPVVPPLNHEELTGLFEVQTKWPVTQDASQHLRRSAYLLVRRTFVYPLFAAFDPPEVMVSCPQRAQTVVPAQALTLLNSPVARALSVAFAQRLLAECGNRPEDIVLGAWKRAFSRPPTPSESERALLFLRRWSLANLEPAVSELCLALFNTNEFIYVD
jgi:cytochrome c553